MNEHDYQKLRGNKPICPRCAIRGHVDVRCKADTDRYMMFLQCGFCNQTGPSFENVNEAILAWIKASEAKDAEKEDADQDADSIRVEKSVEMV